MVYYLVFRPYRKKVSGGEARFRYDFRNQSFVGFSLELEDALKMAHDNPEMNYQIYQVDQPTLNFQMKGCDRYGFRRHVTDVYLPYKRGADGKETYLPNPFVSDEENHRRMELVRNKRLEGLRAKQKHLADLEELIKRETEELSLSST